MQTFESSKLTISVVEHEFVGSFCELESLDLDVPWLQLLVLNFLENLRDGHAYWCLVDDVLHCMEEVDVVKNTLLAATPTTSHYKQKKMHNNFTIENKKKLTSTFKEPSNHPKLYIPHPKIKFKKKL
jgi:hypothetical protein